MSRLDICQTDWPEPQFAGDVIDRWIDFTAALRPGDSIAAIQRLTCSNGLTATNQGLGPNKAGTANTMVQFTITGSLADGMPSAAFNVVCTVTTVLNAAETITGFGVLTIRARPVTG